MQVQGLSPSEVRVFQWQQKIRFMKHIFVWQMTDGYTYSYDAVVPFECDDLQDFILECIDMVQKSDFGCEVLGCFINKYDISNLEYSFYTLDDWFEKNKKS